MLREKRNIAVKNDILNKSILNKSPQINDKRKSNIIVILQMNKKNNHNSHVSTPFSLLLNLMTQMVQSFDVRFFAGVTLMKSELL